MSFKQIAGLLARRIVCNLKVGDRVERGQRMGLIKFGSRVDVLMPAEANLRVKVGDRVKGGSSVLRHAAARRTELMAGHAMRRRRTKRRPPRRGMYVLPSLFTAGNIAAGYYAITQSIRGCEWR